MSQTTFPDSVDVLVIGGGPTGLIITYLLLRSGLKVLAVGQCRRHLTILQFPINVGAFHRAIR